MLTETVRSWLLDASDPSLRYRALTELLDLPGDDASVRDCKAAIPASKAVQGIFQKMHPDGYWLQQNPRTLEWVGDGAVYGSFATTHFCLAYLAELGMDRSDARVEKAANRYLGLQQPDGDWWGHYSCLYGYNIVTFLKLGYTGDPRLALAVDLLRCSIRGDGGYLCDMHEPKSVQPAGRLRVKSCIRGSTKALEAFAALGAPYWREESCTRLAAYFLDRGGIFKTSAPAELVNKDAGSLIFPFHWRAGLVQILYALSKMGYGRDPRLDRAWQVLDARADAEGRYPLDWSPSQSPWKVGRRGEPNAWVTFYVYLAKKHRESA